MPNGKLFILIYEYEEGKYDLGEEWIILQDNTNKVQKNVFPGSFYGKSTKPQNVVFYDNPHDVTNSTKEHAKGTQRINNDTKVQQTIVDNENHETK